MYRRRWNQCCNPMNDNLINTAMQTAQLNNNFNTNSCPERPKKVFEDACTCCGDYETYYSQNNSSDECECGMNQASVFPTNPMYGQSYVPIQNMGRTFTPCVGLKMGTIFPELVSPYSPCQSIEENAFIEATNEIGEGCNNG